MNRVYLASARYDYVGIEEYLDGDCLCTVHRSGIKPKKLGKEIADLMMLAYYQGRKDQAAEMLLESVGKGDGQMIRINDWKKAYQYAEELAKLTKQDVAIRAVKEYGKNGFNVGLASKNDSDYAKAEIIRPMQS